MWKPNHIGFQVKVQNWSNTVLLHIYKYIMLHCTVTAIFTDYVTHLACPGKMYCIQPVLRYSS